MATRTAKKKNRSKSTIKQATKKAQFVLQPSCKTSWITFDVAHFITQAKNLVTLFVAKQVRTSVVSSSRGNDHSLLVFMHRVITKWIHYGALKLFNGFGCNFTNCHFDTCTIWGQEKNFRMFLPSSCGQSGLLRLNLLKKKINKKC